jgi:DNA-binding Lrp family transcriptional regulator
MKNSRDELDWKIIDILKRDARTSNVNIAKNLDVSEGMIRQRIKKLVDSGAIKRFTVVTQSLGLKAIIEVSVEVNVLTTKVANQIKALEGIENVFEISGNRDIIAIVDVDNTLRLNDVIEEIRSMQNVENTETQLVLREI